MSYAPARARSRAPWIAFLLIPLLALASVLVPTASASAAPGDVAGATLQWGVKQSFRSYITSAIAHGHVTGTGVDTATPYGWAGGTGSASNGVGVVAYPGTLQFQGHQNASTGDYALDITLSDVTVRVTSATAAVLHADVVSRDMNTGAFASYPDVALASLDLAAVAPTSTGATLSYAGVPATLTAEGAPAFAGFYPAGTALDPVSFTWPVEQAPVLPALTTNVTAVSAADGFSIDVTGADFTATASYVSIVEKGTDTAFVGAPKQVSIVDGAFSVSLAAGTASLDRAKQYEVIAWATRTNPSADTIYARAAITFTPEQWQTIFPPVPTLAPAVASATAAGLTIDVAATDFDGISATYLSIVEKGTDTAFIGAPKQITAIADGSFTASLTAPAASLDRTKQYDVIAWKTRTNPAADTIYARASVTITAEQWNAVFPASPVLTASVASASAADGIVVSLDGEGFDGITAAYLSIVEEGTDTAFVGAPKQVTEITGGSFTTSLTAPTASLDRTKQYDVIAWKTRTNPAADTIYARASITITATQWNTVLPPEPEAPALTAGSLSWGVKASFRSYVTGPIAHGAISTSGVATSGGSFVFPQAGDAQLANGTGSVSYSGSVRFTGHAGVLDLRLSDPQVRIDSATSGTLLVRVNGSSRVAFATLALASGTKTTDATGAIRYAGVPATITAAGASAFSLEGSTFYPAGTALDPVSFVVGAAGRASGATVVVASAPSSRAANTPASTPPASDGITVTAGEPVEGGEITAEAEGFEPNESGILVVVYSEPTVLATDVTADAAGRVSWTGTLPRGVTGEHTLTFQGSVDRGVVLDIAAATELACTVSDATLVWGFKESFRAYIDGSIANGEWSTVGDVSYETPVFTWTGGTGGADADGALDARFTGSVRFTGHGGVLDTTIADPRIVIDGDRAVLLLDVHGTTQAGEAVEQAAVEFAELDLAGVATTRDGDVVSWTDVPAVLTAAGAAAFGTYPEGEALDPLTITATVESGCAESPAPTPTEAPAAGELDPEPTSDGGWPVWATVLIALLAAAIVAAAVIVLVRRRRA